MDASVVEWTTLVPCKGLSESDSKLYTNFEFCEKNHKHLWKAYWCTKPSIFFWYQQFQQQISV